MKTTREKFNELSTEIEKIKAKYIAMGKKINSINKRARALTKETQQIVAETSQVLEAIKVQERLANDLDSDIEWHADHQQSG